MKGWAAFTGTWFPKLVLAAQRITNGRKGSKTRSGGTTGWHYYDIREGIGFNKTPEEYGAFPSDPYSGTRPVMPAHSNRV